METSTAVSWRLERAALCPVTTVQTRSLVPLGSVGGLEDDLHEDADLVISVAVEESTWHVLLLRVEQSVQASGVRIQEWCQR